MKTHTLLGLVMIVLISFFMVSCNEPPKTEVKINLNETVFNGMLYHSNGYRFVTLSGANSEACFSFVEKEYKVYTTDRTKHAVELFVRASGRESSLGKIPKGTSFDAPEPFSNRYGGKAPKDFEVCLRLIPSPPVVETD